MEMSNDDDKKKNDRNEKKEKKACRHTHIQLNYRREKERTGTKIEKKKKRKKRMCVICFLMYYVLGFGKKVDKENRGKKKKENINVLLRVQFSNLRSNN